MALLTAKKRNKLPNGDFALPQRRAYPIEDRAHAKAALARVAGNGTPAEVRHVRRAVHRKYPDLARLTA